MRRAFLSVFYEGKNISAEINQDLVSFSFKEKADGEADEIEITVADPHRLWQDSWAPTHGDKIRAIFSCENWFEPDDYYELDCGEFEEDDDSLSSSSGGDTVTIKAVPALVSSSLAGQKKTRAWEQANLERIAKDIASAASLELVYEADQVILQRIDQRKETDLAFLQRVCTEQGCRLKLSDNSLIIFEGTRADALKAIPISRRDGDNFSAGRSTAGVYKKVVVTYFDPVTSKNTQYEYKPEDAPETGKVLTINKRVESAAHAERLAKAELRKENAKRKTAQWSGMGHPLLRAGGTVEIQGWGAYDGKYAIKEAEHNFSDSGTYTTSLTLETAQEF